MPFTLDRVRWRKFLGSRPAGYPQPVDVHGAAGRAVRDFEGHEPLFFADTRDWGLLERSCWGNTPQSAADGAALLRMSQFDEPSLELHEQSWRDGTVAEGVALTGQRRKSGIGPFIDIVFRRDHPARRVVVEAQGLSDERREFDAHRITSVLMGAKTSNL